MTTDGYRISLISMASRCGGAEENLDHICQYIHRAGRDGAQLAVFPELALTGYCLRHAWETALPLSHPYVEVLRRTALDCGVTVLVGMAERSEKAIRITQLVCGADGTLDIYHKTHLGMREKQVFSPGSALPVFGKTMPFGILICYDMHFPEAAATLRAGGAKLIISPHASPVKAGSREAVWARYMPARAYDNRVYVACCNACGKNGCGTEFSGGLALYSPDGCIMDSDFYGREGLLTGSIAPVTFKSGSDFPIHRRPELYW